MIAHYLESISLTMYGKKYNQLHQWGAYRNGIVISMRTFVAPIIADAIACVDLSVCGTGGKDDRGVLESSLL